MQPRHFHLIGIAGTAMASLAGLLKSKGHQVTGSDENVYEPMATELREMGIRYAEGYRPENLEPEPDVVVVGNAISRGNPELEAVLNRKLLYTSAAHTIKEEFLRGRHSLAVAGTHGKTTTTSLLAWILEAAGLNPSFLVGGVVENFGTSYRYSPESNFFVIEADEYDTAYFDKGPKMWHYLPHTAIVNNIEFDHADIYRDEQAYLFAFERFINLIPQNGTLVAGWDSPLTRRLAGRSWAPVESFGHGGDAYARGSDAAADTSASQPEGEHPRWTARDVQFGASGTSFTVLHDGREWGRIETPLAGAFNVRNCLAVIAAAETVGADPAGVREGLRTFRSVKRRMEIIGEVGGVTVMDDFAHHPTAVRETLQAVEQRFGDRPVVAVFEPRSYTAQRREFQGDYAAAFTGAERVVIAGLFHPERYTAQTALDPNELVAEWRRQGKAAEYIPAPDEIVTYLARELRGNEVVVVMSNGGFGGLHRKLLDALGTRSAG